MRDTDLNRLLGALDALVATGATEDLEAQVDLAAMRLTCMERRLAGVASASPYLQFLRRIVARGTRPVLAESA